MISEDKVVQPLAYRLLLTMAREGVNMTTCQSALGTGLIFAMSIDTLEKWIEYQLSDDIYFTKNHKDSQKIGGNPINYNFSYLVK